MTTTEALDALTAEIPDRTFTVQKGATHSVYSTGNNGRHFSYVLFVQPGFDGNKCQMLANPDGFEKPVADILALAKQVATTPNEE
jgi:hypothetical protein